MLGKHLLLEIHRLLPCKGSVRLSKGTHGAFPLCVQHRADLGAQEHADLIYSIWP